MIGSQVSHYRIVASLGRGAMGVVYRAEDLRLGRPVALKFLPVELSFDETAKQRFVREARTASTLEHPNICTIYDIDQTEDGQLFIAMALYEGRTLKARIAEGPLPLDEAVEIAAQVAEGLAAAHRHGIVHRDVKPDNLFVAAGVVKILDFGVAKLAGEAGLTREGHAVGTISYMAPEVARSEEAGPPADVWSLGIVLYEMVSGAYPFDRSTMQAAVRSVQEDEPAPLEISGEAGDRVRWILARALDKDPARRFPDGAALAAELRRLQREAPLPSLTVTRSTPSGRVKVTGGVARRRRALKRAAWIGIAISAAAILAWKLRELWTPPPPSSLDGSPVPVAAQAARLRVGVLLPVMNDADPAKSDWPRLMQTILVENLAGIQEVGVGDALSTNGLLQGSLGSESPPRTAPLFKVLEGAGFSSVVDGGVFPQGGSWRLVANLVDVPSGEIVFSHHVRVAGDRDLPAAVGELASQVAGYLQVRVLGLTEDRDLRPYISVRAQRVEAIKAFMQANQYAYRFEPGGDVYLRRAIEIDPDFIAPRLWLISGDVSRGEMEDARRQLTVLRRLEANASPFEQAMIAWAGALIDGDLSRQGRDLEIALRYSPRNNILLVNLAWVRYQMRDYEGAVAAILPAVEAKFRYPEGLVILAQSRIHLGQLEAAETDLEAALAIEPVSVNAYGLLEALRILRGDEAGAARYATLLAKRHAATPRDTGSESSEVTEIGDVWEKLAAECADREPGCAVAILERAVRYEPASAAHRAALSDALSSERRFDAAEQAARDALRIDTRLAAAHLALARALDAKRDAAGAELSYREFLTLAPTSPDAADAKERLGALERERRSAKR